MGLAFASTPRTSTPPTRRQAEMPSTQTPPDVRVAHRDEKERNRPVASSANPPCKTRLFF